MIFNAKCSINRYHSPRKIHISIKEMQGHAEVYKGIYGYTIFMERGGQL